MNSGEEFSLKRLKETSDNDTVETSSANAGRGQVVYKYMNCAASKNEMNQRLLNGTRTTNYGLVSNMPQYISPQMYHQQQGMLRCQTGSSNSVNLYPSNQNSLHCNISRPTLNHSNITFSPRNTSQHVSSAAQTASKNQIRLDIDNRENDSRHYCSTPEDSGVVSSNSRQFSLYHPNDLLEQQQGVPQGPSLTQRPPLDMMMRTMVSPLRSYNAEKNNYSANYNPQSNNMNYQNAQDAQLAMMYRKGVSIPVIPRAKMKTFKPTVVSMNRSLTMSPSHRPNILAPISSGHSSNLQPAKKQFTTVGSTSAQHLHKMHQPVQQYMFVPQSPTSASPSEASHLSPVTHSKMDIAQLTHQNNLLKKNTIIPPSNICSTPNSSSNSVHSGSQIESHKLQNVTQDTSLMGDARRMSDHSLDSPNCTSNKRSQWALPMQSVSPYCSAPSSAVNTKPPNLKSYIGRPEVPVNPFGRAMTHGNSAVATSSSLPHSGFSCTVTEAAEQQSRNVTISPCKSAPVVRGAFVTSHIPDSSNSYSGVLGMQGSSLLPHRNHTNLPGVTHSTSYSSNIAGSAPSREFRNDQLNLLAQAQKNFEKPGVSVCYPPGQPSPIKPMSSIQWTPYIAISSQHISDNGIKQDKQGVDNSRLGDAKHSPDQSQLPIIGQTQEQQDLREQKKHEEKAQHTPLLEPNSMISPWLASEQQEKHRQHVAFKSFSLQDHCFAVQGDSDDSYTECFLKGLATVGRIHHVVQKLCTLLSGLAGSQPQIGVWKTECWRAIFDPEVLASSSGRLANASSGFNCEIWVRRYAEPSHLRAFHCLRMYSPEHTVLPSVPVNARRVKETVVAPQFLKFLPSMGFRKSSTNDVFVSALIFHYSTQPAEGQLMLSLQKHYKDEKLSIDLFPGKYIVEVTGRVKNDELIDSLCRRVLDVCRHIQPFLIFNKV